MNQVAVSPASGLASTDLILEQVVQLPSPPVLFLRIVELTLSDGGHISDLTRLIESDAAISVRLLRLVNSAALAQRQEITTVRRAVVLLGMETVRNVALSLQIRDFIQPSVRRTDALPLEEFWLHGLAVGCAASLLARRRPRSDLKSEHAFLCGILHDIGKLALDACFPKAYARVIRACRDGQKCIMDAEREVLGVDHTVAGRRLLDHWGLPPALTECVWLHHLADSQLPRTIQNPELVRLIQIADRWVRREHFGFSGYREAAERGSSARPLFEEMGVAPDDYEPMVADLKRQLEVYRKVLGAEEAVDRREVASSVFRANGELSRINRELIEESRALKARSRCFDALVAFAQTLEQERGAVGVCRAIIRGVVKLTRCPAATVYVFKGAGDCSYLSLWSSKEAPRTFVDQSNLLGEGTLAARGLDVQGAFRRPTEAEDDLWRRLGMDRRSLPLWSWPVLHLGDHVATILFPLREARIRGFCDMPDAIQAVGSAFGLAIARAGAKLMADRTSEELMEVNRRLHRLQEERLRVRSLGMIAEMAAGAAHELNNPLAIISGRAQILLAGAQDEGVRRSLELMTQQVQRATSIVSELHSFAVPRQPEPQRLLIREVFQAAAERWRDRAAHRLRVELVDPGAAVWADPGLISQVLDELLGNALQFTDSERGRVLLNCPSRASDEKALIEVKDDGVGMPPEVLEHALDPFFSHRPAGRGRGLGLSIAHRLVEISGGRLWLESEPGKGTTAHTEWPAKAQSIA